MHVGWIASCNDHELAAMILHKGQQGLDCFVAVVASVDGKAVRLVDEQHAAKCPCAQLFRLERGLPQVRSDHGAAIRFDHVTLGEQPERRVELANESRNGGLACSRVAGKDQVRRSRRNPHARVAAQFRDVLLGCELTNHCFYGSEPYKLVQFGKHVGLRGAPSWGERHLLHDAVGSHSDEMPAALSPG